MCTVRQLGDAHETRSTAERELLRALRRVQASQPPGDRLTFGTNVLLELAGDVRFRVDFVVGYRGGVVVAEVDGQRAHRGLWASDRSRDYLLEDHGISRVHRVLASALNDPAERDAEVHRMLRRMTRLW